MFIIMQKKIDEVDTELLTKSSTVLQKSPSYNTSSSASSTTSLHHDYWADNVDKAIYDSLSKVERKRQENLYELIYTEKDYVESLEYLQNVCM